MIILRDETEPNQTKQKPKHNEIDFPLNEIHKPEKLIFICQFDRNSIS